MISMAGIPYARDQYHESLRLLQQADPHFRYHNLSSHHQHQKEKANGATAGDTTQVETNIHLSSSSSSGRTPRPPHPDLVKCLQHQGLVHRSLEDYDSALKAYRQALLVLDNATHNNTTVSGLSSSVGVKHQVRDDDDDDDDVRDDFEEKRQGLQMDVADMLAALDKYEDALEVYQAIWDRHEELRRRDDCDSDDSNNNNNATTTSSLHGVLLHAMGRIHAHQGHYGLAQKQLLRALRIKEQLFGTAGGAAGGGAGGSSGEATTGAIIEADAVDDDDDNDDSSSSSSNNNNKNPISDHIVFHPEVGKTLQALGAVYAVQKDDADKKYFALQCFQKALQIAVWQAKLEAQAAANDAGKQVVVDHQDENASVNQHPEVMLVLRNIAILKGEKVPKWGETV